MPDKPTGEAVPTLRTNVVTSDRFAAIEAELERCRREQSAIAELGEAALTRIDSALLTGEACALVADTLVVDYVRVLEYIPSEQRLVGRAIVGHAGPRDITEVDSEALFSYHSADPVEFENLATESRFDGCPVLDRLNVVSGISVRLPGRHEPFGVIGAYSTKSRRFRTHEIDFLQSIANVLGAGIENRIAQQQLEESQKALFDREKLGGIGSWSWSRGIREWLWSDGLYALLGAKREQVDPSFSSFLSFVDTADRVRVSATFQRALSAPGVHQLEHRLIGSDATRHIVHSSVEAIFGRDGKPMRIVGTTRDVTPIAAAQEEQIRLSALLELSSQEWRMTCDAVDDILVIADTHATILRLNDIGRRLLGAAFDETLGIEMPRTREPWMTMRHLVTVVDETNISTTATCRDASTGTNWEVTARALSDDRSIDERIVIVARDTTGIEARERVRREADVLDGINQVISGISSNVLPALQTVESLVSNEHVRRVSDRRPIVELQGYFSDLAELAKPLHLDSRPASIVEAINPVLNTARDHALRRAVSLRTAFEWQLPPVLLNLPRLRRLMSDLLDLAIVRTGPGGSIEVAASVGERHEKLTVTVTIRTKSDLLQPEELRSLVDPNLPKITDRTSLRLALAARIVQEHGIAVDVEHRHDHSSLVFHFKPANPQT